MITRVGSVFAARSLGWRLVPAMVGLLALAVYVQTLLPSTGWGDIARFQYVARVWGIPHRFGYPLYIAISRLFGVLPVGDLAYRINLMSAVFAALAAVTVQLAVMHLTDDWVAAASAACSFAFSKALWKQAVVAEVYSLHAFLVGIVVLILLVWHQTGKRRLLYLGIGLYALSFGNHMAVVTMVPAIVVLILVTDYRVLLEVKQAAILAGLMLLGSLQYLYVIVRAHQEPLLNELGPFSWRGWVWWMTRSRFPGQFFGFSLVEQVDRLRLYLELLEQQFFRWGYILIWIGAWERLKVRARSFAFLALAVFGFYLFGMNYGGATFTIYLIPSYLILAIFLGCGLGAVRGWFSGALVGRSRWVALPLRTGMAGLILLMPLYGVWQNWAQVDQSDNVIYRDMAERFVEQAGPDFVLVDSEPHYDHLEAILYEAWGVKDWRQARWVPPGNIDKWLGQRPIYAWSDGAAYHGDYVEEAVPELPGMVRIVGRQEE